MPSRNTLESRGFTLIELMIVVAIISILAAAAVPNLLSAKLAANESDAVSTLRSLASAQAQFQTIAAMDDDADGSGEFGWLKELAGGIDLNTRANGNGIAAPLDPPILGNIFLNIKNSRATSSGYLFQIFLPDAGRHGVAEALNGGSPGTEDADNAEVYWAAYAYPVVANSSGERCFFLNQRGEIIQTRMDVTVYDRNNGPPSWDAALNNVKGDMADPLAIGGAVANDGNSWVPLQ